VLPLTPLNLVASYLAKSYTFHKSIFIFFVLGLGIWFNGFRKRRNNASVWHSKLKPNSPEQLLYFCKTCNLKKKSLYFVVLCAKLSYIFQILCRNLLLVCFYISYEVLFLVLFFIDWPGKNKYTSDCKNNFCHLCSNFFLNIYNYICSFVIYKSEKGFYLLSKSVIYFEIRWQTRKLFGNEWWSKKISR